MYHARMMRASVLRCAGCRVADLPTAAVLHSLPSQKGQGLGVDADAGGFGLSGFFNCLSNCVTSPSSHHFHMEPPPSAAHAAR
jgi:hypothetical protein